MIFKNLDSIGVSVVIVTYNGKNKLEATLTHLASQQCNDINWEVLLIDNNSNDKTSEFVAELWQKLKSPVPLRIIEENKQGTMYARYSGIINANYRYLLYVDDDNWLQPDYIKYAYNKITNNHEIAAIGGQGELVFEDGFEAPDWIVKYSGYFGSGPQGKEDGDTTEVKGCLYTAGAILDRVWLDRLYSSGFNSVLQGRNGKSLIGGEDTELTYALKLLGGKLFFYSDMKFKHFMPHQRIKWEYLIKLSRSIGFSNYVLRYYNKDASHNIFINYILTIGLITKYFIKSVLNGFNEGSDHIINYYKFLGQFEALLLQKKYRDKIKINVYKINNYKQKGQLISD